MKPIKQTLMSGAMMLALSLVFTSCDDILGEWDRPAPNPVVPTPTPEPEPEPTPTPGLLTGKFTINASGDKIQFSQGNLQATYDGSAWTWAFAEHQWDYVGNAAGNTSINGNGTVSAAGTIDLFGWVGESSTVLTSDPAKYGISNSITLNDYGTKKGSEGETLKSDWGNTIGTGWRTLTGGAGGEWRYLLEFRTTGGTVFGTASARYAHATINTDGTPVNGLILFPDGVDIADSEVTTAGIVNHTSTWDTTKCTSAQWTALAAKGCVFLPAAGRRTGTTVNEANNGYYWASSLSSSDSEYAHNVDFGSSNISYSTSSYRYRGCSVRLVRDVE